MTFVISALFVCATVPEAAEPEFVGVLAVALEDDVARKIELSEETRARLLDVVDRRESDGLEIALEITESDDEMRSKGGPYLTPSRIDGAVVDG